MKEILDYLKGKGNKLKFEVKKADPEFPKSVLRTYSSFANAQGGYIVLGVSENKNKFEITGIKNTHKMINDIWTILNDKNKISINLLNDTDIEVMNIEDKDIIVINVPKADRDYRPVYVGTDPFTGSYKRNGEGDYRCTNDQILGMIRDGPDPNRDSRIIPEYGLDVLNSESISKFRTMFNMRNVNNMLADLNNEEFLKLAGAADIDSEGNIHPTSAGLLMFGKELAIGKIYDKFILDYREYDDSESMEWIGRITTLMGTGCENIFDFYLAVKDRLMLKIRTPFRTVNWERIEDTNQHKAVREILLNSLIHADYKGQGGVRIEVRPHKLVFENPGLFRIPIDDALSGGDSDPRNAMIFRMFGTLGYVERAGSGVYRAKESWKEGGYKDIIFTEQDSPARVIITMPLVEQTVGDKIMNNMTEIVYNMVKKDPTKSIKRMADESGITFAVIYNQLKRLQAEGRIERCGNNRSGYWLIK